MKKAILISLLSLIFSNAIGQNKAEAEKLVNEGVSYHDKGDFEAAILKYDEALELDKNNLVALAEKALTLYSLKKYTEVIKVCRTAIENHENDQALNTIYVAYGNALDGLKKTDRSIEIYDEGIKLFPNYYQLHYNKGISLSSVKKYNEASVCFQNAAILNPKHASSHNAIARIAMVNNGRIPALLAFCRFLAVEPQSNRSKENLVNLKRIMKANVEQTDSNAVTVRISSSMLSDTKGKGTPEENDFAATDLTLSMAAALEFDKINTGKTEVDQFIGNLETICASLEETKKDNYGFFWDYYAPYFIEMKNKKLIEVYSYIAFASSGDIEIGEWLNAHTNETASFFEWSNSFPWKSLGE